MSSTEIFQQLSEYREKQNQLEQQWKELRANALQECLKMIQDFGFTAQDLNLGKDGKPAKYVVKNAGVPKYMNPDGPETWTGRGKRPAWFVRAKDAGYSDDDLLIANNQPEAAK